MEDNKICCPQFQPELWDDKVFEWHKKTFVRSSVRTFFYMPIGFGKAMKKLQEKVVKSNANIDSNMCLSYNTSKWNMDLFLAVDKEVINADNVSMDGHYYFKVYEGTYSDTGKWIENFNELLKEKGYQAKKTYMWYTTCPECAKKYGKNYVVLVAKLIQ
jgi:hypothetical protein